jgi:hypothetical protein
MLILTNFYENFSPCSDVDAIALFNMTEFSEVNLTSWLSGIGITYDELKLYTCQFFTSLKNDSLWNKGGNDALYLPIGNTADQRKYNVYNPIDSNSAFRLTFNGGNTFTNFAIKGNGVNGYCNTFWIPAIEASTTAAAFGVDVEDNVTPTATSKIILGAFRNTNLGRIWANVGLTTGNIQIASNSVITFTGARNGLFFSRRTSSNFNESYREGTSLGTLTTTFNPLPEVPVYLNALSNNGITSFYSTNGVRMALLSGGLYSDTDYLNFRTHYNTFKTNLGIV